MRTYDFSPLYRSTIGFDRLFDMLDQTARSEAPPNWPPYNVERIGEDDYRISMALAGFSPDEIELVQKENTLFVAGHKNADQQQGSEVLHRGIATRPFRQRSRDLRNRHGIKRHSLIHGLMPMASGAMLPVRSPNRSNGRWSEPGPRCPGGSFRWPWPKG